MMNRKALLIAVLATLTLTASVSMADTYSFTSTELATMAKSFTSEGAGSGPLTVSTDGDYAFGVIPTTYGVGFEAGLNPGDSAANPYHPWAAVGVGFEWGTVPQGDLTAYTDYSLTFANDNDDIWWVNLYMNTGWTDAPYSEDDLFSQNGWTAINPGETASVSMSLVGIANLNHVTNIGFQVGAPMNNLDGNPSPGDAFHMSVVPVPAAVLLGVLGLSAAGMKLRRRNA
jgi:hypothetical protein